MVVPSLPPLPPDPLEAGAEQPLGKEALRRAALEARKAFVRTLSDAARALEVEINRTLRGSPEQTERFRAATRRVTGR